MEQHPIPRNISGFQFHLVGDMTLKQFGYLAGGVVLAYLLFRLPLPTLITIPLAGISALIGVAFAFVPIQERPLDRWVIAFLKSIYAPTQYIWRKNNMPLNLLIHPIHMQAQQLPSNHRINHQVANDKLKAYLATIPPTLDASISMKEKAYMDKTLSLFNNSIPSVQTIPQIQKVEPELPSPIAKVAPTTSLEAKENSMSFGKGTSLPQKANTKQGIEIKTENTTNDDMSKQISQDQEKEKKLQMEAQGLKEELSNQTMTKEKFLDLEAKLNVLLSEKEKLTEELTRLKQDSKDRVTAVKPVEIKSDTTKPTVKKLTAQTIKDVAGMPSIPTVPNIVLGVIRDNLEHLLPGIIVTVKDMTGMPVRAIKTNKLGQFASATPLQNGQYLIEVEDPQKRYIFEVVEITLNGQVFMPIEIIAKGQREIMRDKLAKELFGQATM